MKKIIIIALTLLLVACHNEKKTPEYVIPQEDMVNIIVDIHITDGLLTLNNVRRNLAKKDTANYYDQVFENYGYTRADFDTSVYYYSMNINDYDKIYAEVLNKLNEMETELKQENLEKAPKNIEKVDSL
jgi:uncharacterized protein DUF4296